MDSSIEAQLAQLRQLYLKELPQRMELIQVCLGKLDLANWNADEAAALHRHLHSLTGSAGTFGLNELSALARDIERLLQASAKARETPTAETWHTVLDKLDQLFVLAKGNMEAQ